MWPGVGTWVGMKLTPKQVSDFAKKPGRYGDGNGLYLQVTDTLSASWLFRYQIKGREKWMGLGPIHTFSLAEARAKARTCRARLWEGIDPLAEKAEAKAAAERDAANRITFEAATLAYYEGHQAKWRSDKTREQFMGSMRNHVFPVIGSLPVADIDTPAVLRAIEPIWATKNETADRCRQRIENVLDWAKVRGYRAGDNPARFRGHLSEVLPSPGKIQKVRHFASLPYANAPAFFEDLQTMEGFGARALEFTILTAARSGEVRGAVWSEIDLQRKLWTIPATRMKMNKAHEVPLSDTAIKLIAALPREKSNPYVFPGARAGGNLSDMTLKAVLKRMGRGDLTTHGFRATFRTWAAETTGHDDNAVELALAHEVGDAVRKAYQRGSLLEKRVALMADWADYLTEGCA
jgi:integrase